MCNFRILEDGPPSHNEQQAPLTWVAQRFSHRCTCISQDLDNPLSPHYLAFVDVHLEMGDPAYTPASQHSFKTRTPLRDFQWPAADYAPQQVLLNNPAPRNTAGKGKTFRVIEVVREFNVVENGHIQLGVVATNSLPTAGYNGLNNTDVWIFWSPRNHTRFGIPRKIPQGSQPTKYCRQVQRRHSLSIAPDPRP